MIPSNLERIPGYTGFLVINEDGAVVASGGELENNEQAANVIFSIVHSACKKDITPNDTADHFKRISIHYDSHVYLISLSNRKISVVKRKYIPHDPVNV